MPEYPTKRCRRCGAVKPLGQFYRDRSKKDGYRNSCSDCELERQRERYPARAERVKAYQRQYREANAEKITARDKRYYAANREKLTANAARYQAAHRDRVNELHRQLTARHRNAVFDHYGRICACPGCYSTERLTIDHINGDGRQHREALFGRRGAGGDHFYAWLIRNNFPPGYQTLCRRCNTSKGAGPQCGLDHDLEYDVENDAW